MSNMGEYAQSHRRSHPQRQCILNGGGMRGLEHLLQARETPRQEAAVEALAALTMGNADVLDTVVASREAPAPAYAECSD